MKKGIKILLVYGFIISIIFIINNKSLYGFGCIEINPFHQTLIIDNKSYNLYDLTPNDLIKNHKFRVKTEHHLLISGESATIVLKRPFASFYAVIENDSDNTKEIKDCPIQSISVDRFNNPNTISICGVEVNDTIDEMIQKMDNTGYSKIKKYDYCLNHYNYLFGDITVEFIFSDSIFFKNNRIYESSVYIR